MAKSVKLVYTGSMQNEINVVKASGEKEAFNRGKLENSLIKAGADHKVVDEIVGHVIDELKDGMSTSQIYKHAFFLLERNLRPVATRYSLRRAVMDLGPSGFPFEDFIAHILREKGYDVLTDQMILGGCVQHEIDLIAWNENKLIMAEAKFHNQLGIKSDLKIALYIKARFDDIKGVKYHYGKDREVDESWLVTNTKFTNTAIHYAECKHLIFIGWNYPKKGNLQDLIIDSGLHPITCLTTISASQKKALLSAGTVLCKTVEEKPELLRSLGMNKEKTDKVLTEIKEL